jgi:perosamine synthetase
MPRSHFMRHLPPTATPADWTVQWAAFQGQPIDVTRFRSALQAYLGVPACFPASSGRTALFMLLSTLRQNTPDETRREVVLPAYTCPSVAKVVIDAHLQPRFVDVGPYTLSYNTTELATAVNQHTLAVIVVHPFGVPNPVETVTQIATACGAIVIEDAAQSMGAKCRGRYVGTLADFGLFSLGPGKPLSTGGGGFVCTTNETAVQLLRHAWESLPPPSAPISKAAALRLAIFGMAFHPRGWWLATRLGAQRVGENESSWGYSLRGLSSAQAAAGLVMLPALDSINAHRRRRGEQLTAALRNLPGVHLPGSAHSAETPGTAAAVQASEPIYLRFPVVFDSEIMREYAVSRFHEAGIGAGRMYRKTMGEFFPQHAEGVYPGAEHVARCLMTLPTHHYVTDADIDRMIEIVTESVVSVREPESDGLPA